MKLIPILAISEILIFVVIALWPAIKSTTANTHREPPRCTSYMRIVSL
jgi:hypothetical protein